MSTTDAELIQRWARRRDAEAFRELVNRHAAMVFSTSRRILGHTADAEDVTQECFLKLCQLRRPAHNVAAWLHRVVTRGSIDVLRSRTRRHHLQNHLQRRLETSRETPVESPAVATDEVTWRDVEPFVDEAIESLPESVRAPVVLYYLHNRTQESIAASLGVSQATVSHRVRKGVETIRRQLERRGLGLATAVLSTWLSTQTSGAVPAALVSRLGKVAVLGHGADQIHAATEATVEAHPGGWTMKVAVASIAGVVIVGSLALLVFTATRPGDSTPDLARAPAVTPSAEPVAEPAAAPEEPATPDEVTDPAPAIEPATLAGTVRDENEQPIASAEVYLAMQPPLEDDDMARLFLRADYFARSRFLETQTDAAGRYAFEGVLEFGSATLGAFKEGHAGVTQRMTRKAGAATQQVDLVLRAGKTLTGTILDTDGAPVTDAVVSVHGAWSPTSHVFWGAGMGPTDADGRFRVGVGKETTGCHVRVNSDSHGQGFFIEVPVTDEDVELTLKKFARVEGTITWADGAPASGLTVRVNGRLPEPPIPVQRMGRRAVVVHDGLVGDDGTYAIEGLHAQLGYDIFVIDGSLGEVEARRKPLSPRMRHSFRLEPGEVKVWDHSVSRPITIRGRIRTETNGEPLPRAQVGVRKDGKSINDVFAEADDEGFFTLHLNSGAGEYVVHAEPPGDMPTPDPVSDLLAERFGRTLHLAGSEDVEVELAIFDAAVLPIRVLDHSGEPVGTVRTKLHLTFPDGRRAHHDMPRTLDETGRVVFAFHYPATELWYEISAFRNGPAAETRRYEIHPGAVLPEETIKLPRTCDLLAKLVDPSGETVSDRWVSLRVVYEDGTRQVVSSRTDRRGVIDEKGCVRAAPFALELRVGSNVIWKSERVDGTAAEALDLGEIVVE